MKLSLALHQLGSCYCGCGGGPNVPQLKYHSSQSVQWTEVVQDIPFSVYGGCGIPVDDAFNKNFVGLDGRDEYMLTDCSGSISLRFQVGRPNIVQISDCLIMLSSGLDVNLGPVKHVSFLQTTFDLRLNIWRRSGYAIGRKPQSRSRRKSSRSKLPKR